MRFNVDGRRFRLEFERHYRQVTILRAGNEHTIRSKYPYTTATLYELKDINTATPIAHATVGCAPTDLYSNANGRLFALRALTEVLRKKDTPYELRAAIWETYINRGKNQVIEVTATRVAAQKALPPHQPTVAEQNGLDERVIH